MSDGKNLLKYRVIWRAINEMEKIGCPGCDAADDLREIADSVWVKLTVSEMNVIWDWTSENQDIPETVNA